WCEGCRRRKHHPLVNRRISPAICCVAAVFRHGSVLRRLPALVSLERLCIWLGCPGVLAPAAGAPTPRDHAVADSHVWHRWALLRRHGVPLRHSQNHALAAPENSQHLQAAPPGALLVVTS